MADLKESVEEEQQIQQCIELKTKVSKEKTNISKFPLIGLGTWKSKPGEVQKAVECAIDVGYKHIDCAWAYLNQDEIGKAFKNKIDKKIKREDLFVTSKLWNTFHHPDDVVPALEETLKQLNLDYLDLWMIHWPMSFQRGKDPFPKDKEGRMIYGDVIPILDTYKMMEKCVELGLTKHIGISNFNIKQLEEILKACKIRPAVLQCECHPFLSQESLISFCQKNQIAFTAFSPLGSPDRPTFKKEDPSLLHDEDLLKIAKTKNKTVAQVLLRFQVQRQVAVIPKSITPSRIKENFEIWDFELSSDEMKFILSMNKNLRFCVPKLKLSDGKEIIRDKSHQNFPFKDEQD